MDFDRLKEASDRTKRSQSYEDIYANVIKRFPAEGLKNIIYNYIDHLFDSIPETKIDICEETGSYNINLRFDLDREVEKNSINFLHFQAVLVDNSLILKSKITRMCLEDDQKNKELGSIDVKFEKTYPLTDEEVLAVKEKLKDTLYREIQEWGIQSEAYELNTEKLVSAKNSPLLKFCGDSDIVVIAEEKRCGSYFKYRLYEETEETIQHYYQDILKTKYLSFPTEDKEKQEWANEIINGTKALDINNTLETTLYEFFNNRKNDDIDSPSIQLLFSFCFERGYGFYATYEKPYLKFHLAPIKLVVSIGHGYSSPNTIGNIICSKTQDIELPEKFWELWEKYPEQRPTKTAYFEKSLKNRGFMKYDWTKQQTDDPLSDILVEKLTDLGFKVRSVELLDYDSPNPEQFLKEILIEIMNPTLDESELVDYY